MILFTNQTANIFLGLYWHGNSLVRNELGLPDVVFGRILVEVKCFYS
jgi:hypothetical protein